MPLPAYSADPFRTVYSNPAYITVTKGEWDQIALARSSRVLQKSRKVTTSAQLLTIYVPYAFRLREAIVSGSTLKIWFNI
jgi:hypothetical protein